jgi:hypothetical protein
MESTRRLACCATVCLLALGGTVPAWGDSGDPAAGGDPAVAFDSFEVQAQSQAAAGYLFAVGDEENRLAGARVGVAKPADVYALAAAFQRGLAAGYFYAAVLGRSAAGGAGVAPEPPPGETRGLYPSEPRESTWEGPVTAGAEGPVVDGRSEAKATATPTGDAALELHAVTVPGQLVIEGGRIGSRGAPVAAGIEGESVSVLSGVTIGGGLRIETLTSRAYGLVPAAGGDPTGTASTVIEGASVNGTPVRITHAGVELGDQTPAGAPKAQLMAQIRQALAADNIEDVRLVEAAADPQTDGVRVSAGVLRVIYRNTTFGASNPQGFSGGGFELGGATVSVTARRSATGPAPATRSTEPAPPAAAFTTTTLTAAATGPTDPPMTAPWRPAVAPPARAVATAPTDRGATVTRLVPAASTGRGDSDRNTARWTGVVFLLLGSIPLGVVLAFRLARPTTRPTSSRKGS